MTRSQMMGGLATGLLMFGFLVPAVANASTDSAGATASHARGASAFTHDAAASAKGTAGGTSAGIQGGATTTPAHGVPLGTPIQLTTISSSLLLFPQILGQVDRHR